jgi:hypothetical protein
MNQYSMDTMAGERLESGLDERGASGGRAVAPIAVPMDRRVLFHSVQEVRVLEQVGFRFAYSLVPHDDAALNRKAAILTAHFLDSAGNVLPPGDRQFRQSDRYGHFIYVGPAEGSEADVAGELVVRLTAPRGAARVVICLMPFANPTIRIAHAALEIGPLAA